MIGALNLPGFFILHRDLLELAREVAVEVRGPDTARALLPPGRGRGSSVSSIVCYLTGLSHIDPVENDLFLGRFLNEELTALPDIDLDFPRDIREVLIPRVHERYGTERSALVAAFPTFRSRGAIRELGKVLGLPPGELERVARGAEPFAVRGVTRDVETGLGLEPGGPPPPVYDPDSRGDDGAPFAMTTTEWLAAVNGRDPAKESDREATAEERYASLPGRWGWLARLCDEAYGLPRHLSQHSGGMIVSTRPLIDCCPVLPAAMEGRQLCQWDKDSCADAGFLKIDLLGLGMLSAVERCVEAIARTRSERIDLSRIPFDDPETYTAIQEADTMGVFQIESRAQMQSLRRTRPESLEDLTIQVAIVRPGPILGGAVNPYIARRQQMREDPDYVVPYDHPSLEPVLKDTLGTIIFQDQVIESAMAFAGFSPGEAEGLRRAMSRKRSAAAIEAYHQRFVDGAARTHGVDEETAERVYSMIVGFSGFGFPKAHGAAFGLLAYQSTWLRVHYGPEFLCALLNEQPMGFYAPDTLAHEAQRRGHRAPPARRQRERRGVHGRRAAAAWPRRIAVGHRLGAPHRHRSARARLRQRGAHATRSPRSSPRARRAGGSARSPISPPAPGRAGPRWRSSRGPARATRWPACPPSPAAPTARGGRRCGSSGSPRRATSSRREPSWRSRSTSRRRPSCGGSSRGSRWSPTTRRRASRSAPTRWPCCATRLPAGAVSCRDLERMRHKDPVRIGGLVVARQRPGTAKGIVFLLLEDEFGTINLIVPPDVYEKHRLIVRAEPLLLAEGRLEKLPIAGGALNVFVHALKPLVTPEDDMARRRRAGRAPRRGRRGRGPRGARGRRRGPQHAPRRLPRRRPARPELRLREAPVIRSRPRPRHRVAPRDDRPLDRVVCPPAHVDARLRSRLGASGAGAADRGPQRRSARRARASPVADARRPQDRGGVLRDRAPRARRRRAVRGHQRGRGARRHPRGEREQPHRGREARPRAVRPALHAVPRARGVEVRRPGRPEPRPAAPAEGARPRRDEERPLPAARARWRPASTRARTPRTSPLTSPRPSARPASPPSSPRAASASAPAPPPTNFVANTAKCV